MGTRRVAAERDLSLSSTSERLSVSVGPLTTSQPVSTDSGRTGSANPRVPGSQDVGWADRARNLDKIIEFIGS